VEGNGRQQRQPGDVESQVRRRLAETAGKLPPSETVSEHGLSDEQLARILASLLAQATALQEIAALLAAEIDSLKA